MNFDLTPLYLTFQLATVTTAILLIIAVPIAYYLAFTRSSWKPVFEALVAMPLVLPPTVLGFYLLVLLGRNSPVGGWLYDTLGLQLVFTFEGLVVASVIYSLPFMVQPLQAGFSALSPSLIEASYTLGKSRWETLIYVILPNSKGAVLAGIVLSFAHTIGEFGVVLMMGGNIPGETRVASIAIFDEVQALNYSTANFYAAVLFVVSFVVLFAVYYLQGKNKP